MKKTKLNWFDRLMIDVTFAEAHVQSPGIPKEVQREADNTITGEEQAWDEDIQDGCTSPAS